NKYYYDVIDTVYYTTLLFFLYSYHHHPDLHSFPTRRSSDLTGVYEHAGKHQCLAPVGRWRRRSTPYHGSGSGGGTHETRSSASLDRKSTRLNSSHRTISYAVFCLKKKTQSTYTKCMIAQ